MSANLVSLLVSILMLLANVTYFAKIEPKIVFFDVGQGDSMLFVSGSFQLLIDGGPGKYLIQKFNRYVRFYDRSIEVLILTHPHLDHYAGLVEVIKRFEVKTVVLSAKPCKFDEFYTVFMDELMKKGVRVVSGLAIKGEGYQITATSKEGSCVKTQDEINNSSVITKLDFGGISILNMGDAHEDLEMEMKYSEIDILKAGHHCSVTSSSENFLKSIQAKYAICSAGWGNIYGHPSEAVLKRFERFGVRTFVTFETGDIVVNLTKGLIYNQRNKVIGQL